MRHCLTFKNQTYVIGCSSLVIFNLTSLAIICLITFDAKLNLVVCHIKLSADPPYYEEITNLV